MNVRASRCALKTCGTMGGLDVGIGVEAGGEQRAGIVK
jgi:hypothetical protein